MKNSNNNVVNKLFSSVVILTLSNLFVKIIGVVFKIPLHNLLGDLGMGYFNSAYNIFVMLYIILTTGLPMASTIMISAENSQNNVNNIRKIHTISLITLTLLGLLSFILLYLFSNLISKLTGNINTNLSIKSISIAILFLCIICAYRGFFQGFKLHYPTAISSVIESIGKFGMGVILAIYSLNKGYSIEVCAAYAIFGVVIGEFCAMIYVIILKRIKYSNYTKYFSKNEQIKPNRELLKQLFFISFPIFLSAFTLNLCSNIDTFTIVNLLNNKVGINTAEAIYGNYSTLAITLFRVPSAFILPISTVILPAIVDAISRNDNNKQEKILTYSIRLVYLISIPCMLGLAILSKPILNLLFSNTESVNSAYKLLSLLSISIIPSSYLTVSSTVLQSYKHEKLPIITTVVGAIIKLVLNLVLIPIESIGIYGAPIATFVSYLIMAIINYIFIKKYVPIKTRCFNNILKIIGASLISSGITIITYYFLNNVINNKLATIITIIITIIIYILFLIIFKGITKEDLEYLPKSRKTTKNDIN